MVTTNSRKSDRAVWTLLTWPLGTWTMAQVYRWPGPLGPLFLAWSIVLANVWAMTQGSAGVSGGHLVCPWYINIGKPGLFERWTRAIYKMDLGCVIRWTWAIL